MEAMYETTNTRSNAKNEFWRTHIARQKKSGKTEKVLRIKEKYDLKEFEKIFAYGDSKGDREMLALAHEGYYKWKKT